MDIDAGLAQAVHLHAAAFIVADGANIFHAQPEFGSRHDRARDLAAGTP